MSEKFLKIKAGNEIYTKENIDNLFSETDVYLINKNSSYQLSDVVKLLNSVARKFGTKEYYSPYSWFNFNDIDDTTASLTFGSKIDCVGMIIVPEKTEDGKYVVETKDSTMDFHTGDLGVFYNCNLMTECVLPNQLTGVGDYTFANCTTLSSVYIPDTVTRIGDRTFNSCSALTKINIPSSLTSLGELAFVNCKELKSIQIPKSSSMTEIKESTFNGCKSLSSVELNYNLLAINSGAFAHCASLSVIEIPEGVQSIGTSAFLGCSSLLSIDIPEITSINDNVFYNCQSLSTVNLPNSVFQIGTFSFSNCISLKEITLPTRLSSIGSYAFSNCYSLTNIVLPNSLTHINSYAFSNCSSLTGITIPESITSLSDFTFSYCYSLRDITLPNSLTSIGHYSFSSCSSLTNLTIPSQVSNIGVNAFMGCNSLSLAIFEGKTLDEISSMENYPFGFSFDTKISCENAIFNVGDEENYISPYSWFTFRQESGNESEVSLVYANPEKCIGKIVIPTTTEDGKYVVNINGGKFADQRAFYMCNKITECILPSKLRIIGREAFSGLNIKELTIPESVNLNSIDYRAFYNSYLSSVTFEGKTMEQVQSASHYLAFGLSKDTQIICTDGTISYPGSV